MNTITFLIKPPYLVLRLIPAILSNEMANFWWLDHHSILKSKKLLLFYWNTKRRWRCKVISCPEMIWLSRVDLLKTKDVHVVCEYMREAHDRVVRPKYWAFQVVGCMPSEISLTHRCEAAGHCGREPALDGLDDRAASFNVRNVYTDLCHSSLSNPK